MDNTHPALQPSPNAAELEYLRLRLTHSRQLAECFLALWGQRTTLDRHPSIYPVFQPEPTVGDWAMLVHILRVYHPKRPAYGEIAWDAVDGVQYAIRCRKTFFSPDGVKHIHTWLQESQQVVQRGRAPGGRFQDVQEFLDVSGVSRGIIHEASP
jgi:hypothetical protein